jgi:predicted secreted Zn-dependent protease
MNDRRGRQKEIIQVHREARTAVVDERSWLSSAPPELEGTVSPQHHEEISSRPGHSVARLALVAPPAPASPSVPPPLLQNADVTREETAHVEVEEQPIPDEFHVASHHVDAVIYRNADDSPPPNDDGSDPKGTPSDVPPASPSGVGSSTQFSVNASARVISADNLSQLWARMTNSGTREAASVLPKLTPQPQYEYDGNDRVKKVTVTVVEAKEMPNWKEADAQCPPIRAEWTRFFGVLDNHENTHVAIDRKHFSDVHRKLVGKKREAAWKALDDEIDAADKENQAYDTRTSNGVAEGANINTAVQCAPQKVGDLDAPSSPSDAEASANAAPPVPDGAQAKLEVSQPGDALEREADETASRVMRGDAVALGTASRAAVSRKECTGPGTCDCEECRAKANTENASEHSASTCAAPGACECADCRVRRAADPHGGTPSVTADTGRMIDDVVAGDSGRPLDADTLDFMESRFGHHFAAVRVHDDTSAAASAKAIQARAYTVGPHIVFAPGQYRPSSESGRRLLAHELAHVVQQGTSAPRLIQRDTPSPAPAPPAAVDRVEFNGRPLSPIEKGTMLTADPELIHGQLRNMIIEHGVREMNDWVNALEGGLTQGNSPNLAADQQKYGKGDVSGAPDPQVAQKQRVVIEFKKAQSQWQTTVAGISSRFDQEVVNSVNALLDQSEAQILKEAMRYGIALDPTGNKISPNGLSSVMPVPPQRQGLKHAATDLLAEWNKKDKEKATAQVLIASPSKLVDIQIAFDNKRRDKIREFPILAAYAKDKEKLAELAAERDPAGNIEKEMNKRLDNIAWVRSHVEDRKDQLKFDPRIRSAAKRGILAPPRSVEDRVVEDEVKDLRADQETADNVKSALGFGLLILAFVPGGQLAAAVGGALMMGSDVLTKFEDYFWEEAASGTAFDRAAAISQSDPSLFKLGLEIAVGIGQGVVEVAVIGKAVETFKVLAPVVREALAARAAARAARSVAARVAEDEVLTRLENSGEGETTKRLRRSIEKGEFDKDAPSIADAARAADAAAAGKSATGEVTGLPDAFTKETHTVRITPEGNIRCSKFCMELADSILHRLEQFGLENLTEEQRAAGQGLVAEAKQARLEAAKVAEGSPEEEALKATITRIETSMVELEREIGMALKKTLGVTRDYAGELRTARDRVDTILEQQRGRPGYGEMQRTCGEVSNKIGEIQGGFDKLQRSFETGRPPESQMDAYRSTVDGLMKDLDELNKRIGGIEREQFSQLQALDEGGELYGKSDAENRDALGKKLGRDADQMKDEKISDTIARKKDGSFIVTESKGGNVNDAVIQLQNTIRLLLQAEPKAAGRISARITVTPDALARLQSAEGLQGYCVGSGGQLEVGVPGSSKPFSIAGIQGPVIVQAF